MNRKLVLILSAAAAAFVGFYFGSPYYAAYKLRDAVASGNTDDLEDGVDFESVQSSLKAQMTIGLTNALKNDPEMKKNPFAGLGVMMIPAVVDKAIASYVTPEGLASLVKGRKPGASAANETPPDLDYTTQWSGLDRFRVHMRRKDSNEEGLTLLFQRQGLTSWKMTKIELPEKFFERSRSKVN